MRKIKHLPIWVLVLILIGWCFALSGRLSIKNSLNGQQSKPLTGSVPQERILRKSAVYDPDPNHLWNRLYRSLYIRIGSDGQEYGDDELDPLLWEQTRHLLSGPAYQLALNLLDEFLSTHAEQRIADPLKRAFLQHDLWAIFDWLARRSYAPDLSAQQPKLQKLQIRLAQVIRQLALSKEQIEKLPNNYADAVALKAFGAAYDANQPQAAFLPPDLFRPDGSWVPLSVTGGEAIAPAHLSTFSRSVFQVFLNLPAGRQATLAYIKKLQDFPQPWLPNPQDFNRVLPNPALPQFPTGTQLALVQQMILIDQQGNLLPTSLTEQVQIRVHQAIPDRIPEVVRIDLNEAPTSLDVFEFRLSRARLFASKSGGLRAVARDEEELPVFQSHGVDPFEMSTTPDSWGRPILNSCAHCHFRPGIHSVLSRERRQLIVSWDRYEEGQAINIKQSRYDWGLLRGLWELPPTWRAK